MLILSSMQAKISSYFYFHTFSLLSSPKHAPSYYVYENEAFPHHLKSSNHPFILITSTMEFQEDQGSFKKNDIVFAICNNELPWPAQISKINDDNYNVKFIGHKSQAIIKKDKLIPFTNEYIGEIIKEYKTLNEASLVKVLRAIDQSRTIQDKMKRKEEREANKPKKAKKAKENKAEKPKSEKNTRTRNQSKKTVITEQKEDKVQAVQIPNQQPMQEAEKVETQKSASNEVNNEMNNEAEQSYSVSPIELQQKQVSPISSMVHELKPQDEEQYIQQNSYVSQPENNDEDNQQIPEFSVISDQQLEIVVPIQDNQEDHHEEEFQQDMTQTEEHLQYLDQAEHEQYEEYNGPVHMSEMKRFQPITPVDFICMYLQKMINYLGRLTFEPLNKEEKEKLAELLMNHRKVHDEPRLLDHMVRFIQAFDFKLKEERKKCFIEYIKIKERVECCLVFRSQMVYDDEINKILDRYLNRFNDQ